MNQERDLIYKVKCRGCNKITEMFFGTTKTTELKAFELWAKEHSTFPFNKQCRCDNGSMLFHDLVSYKPLF